MWNRLPFVTLGLAFLLAGCDDRSGRTQKLAEAYAVVPGTPGAETGTPKVLTDDTRETDGFKVSTPHQCDLFQQLSVRKVDILWVVDSSGSMAVKQARLAANFQGFMNQLVNANPPIDFHIGVVSTDTDDPGSRGVLRTWALSALGGSYISCIPKDSGGSTCNTGTTADAVTAFKQMVTVGTSGSAVERGLYATYLALTNPNNISTGTDARFIRPEAALYVVVVSDEDDASCNPLAPQAVCTADPGCRCAPEGTLAGSSAGAFGSAAYFTRFLETYKGFGNGDRVALAAIVATDPSTSVPSQFGDPSTHVGCCRTSTGAACPTTGTNPGTYEIGYFGDRYVKVATDTGGVAVSICSDDFSGALSSLGYAASGLRRDFRLSRGPFVKTGTPLEVYLAKPSAATCQVDGNCSAGEACKSNRCAKKTLLTSATPVSGARYERCEGSVFRNSVRFDDVSVPESLSAIEFCYDVDPEFKTSCP
jgi:hypothetical protein